MKLKGKPRALWEKLYNEKQVVVDGGDGTWKAKDTLEIHDSLSDGNSQQEPAGHSDLY